MSRHYTFLVTDANYKQLKNSGQLPEEISHLYLRDIQKNDEIWFFWVTKDLEDALLLGKFVVAEVTRMANGKDILRRLPRPGPLAHISLAEHEIRLESVTKGGNTFGTKCCPWGPHLWGDTDNLFHDRGIRTGMQLLPDTVSLLEQKLTAST